MPLAACVWRAGQSRYFRHASPLELRLSSVSSGASAARRLAAADSSAASPAGRNVSVARRASVASRSNSAGPAAPASPRPHNPRPPTSTPEKNPRLNRMPYRPWHWLEDRRRRVAWKCIGWLPQGEGPGRLESQATGSVVAALITPYSSPTPIWGRGLKALRKIDANHFLKRTCAIYPRTTQGPQIAPPAHPAQAARPTSQ